LNNKELEAISKMYAREKKARKEAESILETKSLELFELNKQLSVLNNNLESEVNIRIQQIHKQEKKYQSILESVNDTIYKTDSKGLFTYANPLAQKITGYSLKELMQMSFTDLVSELDKKQVIEFYYDQYQQKKKTSYTEFRITTKLGEEKWVGQSLQMTSSKNTDDFECTGVVRDITEVKKIQRELEAAKNKALNSTRSKEMFLANMSHEIRTPMNAIVGMTSLLSDSPLNKKQNEYIKAIQISTGNLLVIINDILDFSKIESGKLEIESIDFDIRELINNTKKSIELKAEENDNLFILKIDDKVPTVLAIDPVRLNQILINLVGNALKFTKNGTVKLVCNLIKKDKNNASIKIEVIDSGIGIEPSKLNKIFDSFSQEDESTTRTYGGTGLGLSISKQLVSLLGGDLKVTSTVDKGSTFFFELQLPIGKPIVKKVSSAFMLETNPLKNKNILLVEDNEINRFLATSVITKWLVNVDIAENGQIAIDKLKEKEYDLVLMDVQMPVMGGIESTIYIREDLKLDIPIIALTANAVKGDRERFILAGMDDYISKPFDPSDLFNKMLKYIT
tara:strand:+ start:988 stop:2688 length:1701 start_codon:yes stop_codon:yes gene_type:complete